MACGRRARSVKVGFVGAGIMGSRMATNILKAGHTITIYSRTRAKAEPLLAKGARWADSPGQAASDAACTITMVGGPEDVEEIYFGKILGAAKPGCLLIDMTTSSPTLAERIHKDAKARGVCTLDAPVTGGPAGAESASLTIMVGGAVPDFERAKPILSILGTTLLHFGVAGSGQRAKLVNQIVTMQNVISAIEGLFLSRKAGLDGETVMQLLQSGFADSKALRNSATKAFQNDFTPNFQPSLIVKDLRLALEEASRLGMELPGLATAKARWEELLRRYPSAGAIQEVARLYM